MRGVDGAQQRDHRVTKHRRIQHHCLRTVAGDQGSKLVQVNRAKLQHPRAVVDGKHGRVTGESRVSTRTGLHPEQHLGVPLDLLHVGDGALDERRGVAWTRRLFRASFARDDLPRDPREQKHARGIAVEVVRDEVPAALEAVELQRVYPPTSWLQLQPRQSEQQLARSKAVGRART